MIGDKLYMNVKTLSALSCRYMILAALLIVAENISFAQCSGGTASGSLTLPNSNYQTAIYATIGLYKTFTANEGSIYNFTLCSNGGSATYDTQLTILDNSGNFTAGGYNDDYCGLASELTWVAPSAGVFRVLITQYVSGGCIYTGAISTTLAYKEIMPQYYGGNKDGWSSTMTTIPIPLSNIFTGGNGQGWASVRTSEVTTLSNFFAGGTHAGWSTGSLSISDPPTIAITSSATDPTNLTSIPVTFTFSESVTGFIAGDITVTNGTVSGFAGSGSTYTANITPTAAGAVSISVTANKATDVMTNGNLASNTFTLTYDNVSPTVSITTTASSPTNTSIPVTITFSESMTGFIVSDITVTNGTAGSFAGSGTTYTATITPTTAGAVSISVTANKATDAASNGNTLSNTVTLTYDNVAPTVSITSSATDPTVLSSIPITFTFSEGITGFIVSDIIVTNGTAGSFAGSGTTYTAIITPTTTGVVNISVAANSAADAATNGNLVSNTLTRTYDNVAPTVTITTSATDPTNLTSIPITITFSETVIGFNAVGITVTNGTVVGFAGSGATYTANITPSVAGPINVSVAANKATDVATNANTASNTLTLTYDNIAPTVAISTTATEPTNLTSIPITIIFSESITGFNINDITVTNGTAGSFTGSGTTYTATLTPSAAGPVSISIVANMATDLATNGNTISNTLTLTYDNVAPTVVISTTVTSPTVLSSIPVTITFSENMTGFTIGDITVTNGTVVNFTGSGTTYTASISPASTGIVTVTIAGGKATDEATNPNTVSNTLSINYQGTPLKITNENFVDTFEKGGTLTVSITVNDASKVSKVNFKSRGISEPVSALKTVEVNASGTKYEKVIAAAEISDRIGLKYYFEVIDQALQSIPSSEGKSYIKYLSTNSQEIPYKSGNLPSDYQIISVPLKLTTPAVSNVFKNLMPYDNTQWRLFDYTNNDNREYPKFSDIEAGKGYWFISKNQVTINPGEGTTVNVDENSPFTISLPPNSWTLIGNPYNFRISWTEVLTASNNPSLASVLTLFNNGTLSDGTTLDRYRGGFIENKTSSNIQLKVPVLRNTTLGGEKISEEIYLEKEAWDIPITVTNGLLTNERGGVGMNPKASAAGIDTFDKVSVPLLDGLDMPELMFSTSNPKISLTKEIVPTQDNFSWYFTVKNGENSQLQWPIIEQRGSKQLILLDPSSQRIVDMTRENNTKLSSESTSFRIIFGDQHYVRNILDKELVTFGQPYPNPASEEVKFPIYISELLDRSKVSIRIYSITGSEIATLVDDYFNKGVHVLSWKPTVDSGLYLVSMQLGNGEMRKVKLVIH